MIQTGIDLNQLLAAVFLKHKLAKQVNLWVK